MELGFGILVGCVVFMAIKLHKISKCVRDMTVLMLRDRDLPIDEYNELL